MRSATYYESGVLSTHIEEIQTLNKTYIDHANKTREDALVYKYNELLQKYKEELTILLSKTPLSKQQIMEEVIHPFNNEKVALDQNTSLGIRAALSDKRYVYLQTLTKILIEKIKTISK